MKKKLYLLIIFVLMFQVFNISFLYVEASDSKQPKTCNWPSDMMVNYFDFQSEVKSILLWTEINSERFSAEFGSWWLFTNKVLTFNSTSAIELLSSSVVWNIRSFVSNSVTSLVLLELAAFSVVQSNIEWFAILFTDWPIVRDYKHMLDIETELFDIAYFRSKEIPLTRPLDSEWITKLKTVIKKYQDLWLLEEKSWWIGDIHWSISDLMIDLVSMNASMKQFIMVGGKIGKSWLRKYNWCFWNIDKNKCTREFAILKFSDGAISGLYEDYKEVRSFWKCNSYANQFKWTIGKTINNNVGMVSSAIKDVGDSIKRLKNALFKKERWDFRDPCKDLSDYEMAQLQAYWWWNWECWEWINLFTAKKYIKDKIAHIKQKKKHSEVLRSAKTAWSNWNLNENLETSMTDAQRAQKYREIVGSGNLKQFYDFDLWSWFLFFFETTMDEYAQSQEHAASVDVSTLFPHFRWVLDQVDATTKKTNDLQKTLQKIKDKQCSS